MYIIFDTWLINNEQTVWDNTEVFPYIKSLPLSYSIHHISIPRLQVASDKVSIKIYTILAGLYIQYHPS